MNEDKEDQDEYPEHMTPAQRDAVRKAWELLTEFFERAVLILDWDVDRADGKTENAHEGWWAGGALSAVGMCEFGKQRILGSGERAKSNEPGDDQ